MSVSHDWLCEEAIEIWLAGRARQRSWGVQRQVGIGPGCRGDLLIERDARLVLVECKFGMEGLGAGVAVRQVQRYLYCLPEHTEAFVVAGSFGPRPARIHRSNGPWVADSGSCYDFTVDDEPRLIRFVTPEQFDDAVLA